MLHPDVRRAASDLEGQGLQAYRLIPKGTVVCAPGEGDVHLKLTPRDVVRLPKYAQSMPYQHGDHYILNLEGCQYLNHSCDPNLVWADDDRLVAARDIQPGEEVAFDYGTSEARLVWRHKWLCNCGASGCRKVVTGRDCLDPAFQERYRGHLTSWVLQFIEQNRGLRGWINTRLYQAAEFVRILKGAPRPGAG